MGQSTALWLAVSEWSFGRVGGGGGVFWLRFTEIRFREYTSEMGGVGVDLVVGRGQSGEWGVFDIWLLGEEEKAGALAACGM